MSQPPTDPTGEPGDGERTFWALSYPGMAFGVLSAGLTGTVAGPIYWFLAVGATMVSLGMFVVWHRSAVAIRQGRAASCRFGLPILAAVQAGFASYWLAATGTSPAPALIALQPSVAVYLIGVPAILAALLLAAALKSLARRRDGVPELSSSPRAYRTFGAAGAYCAVLSAGSAIFVHAVLWVLPVIVVLASLGMIWDWTQAPRDLTRLRVHWASIVPALALIPAACALVQAACVLAWITTTNGGQERHPALVGGLILLPFVAAALFTAAKMDLGKNLRVAGALTYTEQTGRAA